MDFFVKIYLSLNSCNWHKCEWDRWTQTETKVNCYIDPFFLTSLWFHIQIQGCTSFLLWWAVLNQSLPRDHLALCGHSGTPRLKTAIWRLMTANCYCCGLPLSLGGAQRPLSITDLIISDWKTKTDCYSVGTCVCIIS